MTRRYITVAQADRMRREALGYYEPLVPFAPLDVLRDDAVEYFIVPDDDPRLTEPAPDPPARAE